MHEFSIAQSLCEIAIDEARQNHATEVVSITCRFGVFRQIVPEIMQTAFALSAEGTLLAGAILIFETEGIRTVCLSCGRDEVVDEVPFSCSACESTSIRCSGGQDITLVSMEINQGDGHGDSGAAAARREEPG